MEFQFTLRGITSSTNQEKEKDMNIYVGNLYYGMSEEELRDEFASFGEVANVRIITDRETQRSKGFGFVDMPNDEEARKAIEELNGKEVSGRTLRVNEARPREERPRRENRY